MKHAKESQWIQAQAHSHFWKNESQKSQGAKYIDAENRQNTRKLKAFITDDMVCLSIVPCYFTDREKGATKLSSTYNPKWHWKLRTDKLLGWEMKSWKRKGEVRI